MHGSVLLEHLAGKSIIAIYHGVLQVKIKSTRIRIEKNT